MQLAEAITYKVNEIPSQESLVALYSSVCWGHKDYPEMLVQAYNNSTYVACAYAASGELIGAARAISDLGFTVYFPDLLVKPEWQRNGIGTALMQLLVERFAGYHNMTLVAEDDDARKFYERHGFQREAYAMSIRNTFKIVD